MTTPRRLLALVALLLLGGGGLSWLEQRQQQLAERLAKQHQAGEVARLRDERDSLTAQLRAHELTGAVQRPRPAQQRAPAQQEGPVRAAARSRCAGAEERGLLASTELRGDESAHHSAASAEECVGHCGAAGKGCAGWTFNSDEKLCRLKSRVASKHACHVCTSWQRHGPAAGAAAQQPLVCRAPDVQGPMAEARRVFEQAREHSEPSPPSDRPKDVVLVIAWQRAAFLLATLDNVLRAQLADEHVFVFQLDEGFSVDVLAVACAWPLEKRIVLAPPHADFTPANSNSYSVLEAYRYGEMVARGLCSQLLYLLEEDIFVAKDFFRFHRAAHTNVNGLLPSERPAVFAVSAYNSEHSSACDDPDLPRAKAERLHGEVYTRQFYHSLGVSFRVDTLPTITQHAARGFYEDRVAYNEQHFGTLSIYHGTEQLAPADLPEQDALIGARQYTVSGLYTLFPYCSRAFHAGFTGYNHAHSGGGMVRCHRPFS